MSTIDLHIHSNVSLDGELSAAEIIVLSKQEKIEVISITDHNSIRGAAEAVALSAEAGVTVVPGIEIDCVYNEINLHVLGYNIEINDFSFIELERQCLAQEKEAIPKSIRALQKSGFAVSEKEVFDAAGDQIPSPELVAEVLLAKEENFANERLAPYRAGGDRSDMPFLNFYRDYFTKNKPAYIEKTYINLDEAIAMVKQSGGIPVIAHPGESLKENEDLLPGIISRGIAGIEVFSSYHSAADTTFYFNIAKEYGLGFTCGSDFHGKNKPSISLGSVDSHGTEETIKNIVLNFDLINSL
ncbi:MAG: PHP domain-containing protein [bacterium]|nr:PHP domain-containing protein [bacterium]